MLDVAAAPDKESVTKMLDCLWMSVDVWQGKTYLAYEYEALELAVAWLTHGPTPGVTVGKLHVCVRCTQHYV